MKWLKALAALVVAAALPCMAQAQTSPNLSFGQVLTPAQWNALFAGKQDFLGSPPLLITGGTLTGLLGTAASTTASAGLNCAPGVAPTSPNNGDIWCTVAGLFTQVNGSTVGPLGTGGGGGGSITIGGVSGTSFGLTNLTMVGSTITAGSMASQSAGSVAITGGAIAGASLNMSGATITNLVNPTNSLDAANKAYVLSVAGSGLNPLPPSRLATAAILPGTPTYNNGSSGVGATLTSAGNTTLTVDGTLANLNDVVLVKTQASAFQNGVYTLTQAGSVSQPWILTRASYFNQSTETLANSTTAVTAGSTQTGTWIMNPAVVTIGTDPSTWALYIAGAIPSIAGQTVAFTCATELNCTGATFAFSTIAANNVLGNFTSGTAKPIANAMPSCADSGGNHINYTSGTGFSCGNSSGGAGCTMTSVSSNTTLTASTCQTILVNATSAAVTITLFAASSGVSGDLVTVKKTDSSTNDVIVVVTGGGAIDSGTGNAVAINTQNGSVSLRPNATQWWQV